MYILLFGVNEKEQSRFWLCPCAKRPLIGIWLVYQLISVQKERELLCTWYMPLSGGKMKFCQCNKVFSPCIGWV